jgi:uncharacterized membrane protein
MKITFTRYPIDIIFCIYFSVILIPIVLFIKENIILILLGLPFLLFIPGYLLTSALFPTKKNEHGIDTIERVALSFGLSIAIVPLIGLLLNYTPWGIRTGSILFSLFIFIIGMGIIAILRWKTIDPLKRHILVLEISFPKTKTRLESLLVYILGICIIIAFASAVYVVTIPRTGEKFTEFYLLGTSDKIDDYPHNLSLGEDKNVIIGILNHEYRTVNYTVEIWLINQSLEYNDTTHQNNTIYDHMWFMDKITTSLDHVKILNDTNWKSQWQYNYSFSIKRKGEYKLTFLLFTNQTQQYNLFEDYRSIAKEKIAHAYERIYLQINVF